jgi:LuxR family maltose regulon positive regulatory protein
VVRSLLDGGRARGGAQAPRRGGARGHFRAAERLSRQITTPPPLGILPRTYELTTLLRLESADAVEKALADMGEPRRESAQTRAVEAMLRLSQNDPEAAAAILAPAVDAPESSLHPAWRVQVFLLEARTRDALGDTGAASRALERALDLAEPDGVLLPFLLHPTPLLARHAPHLTTHASLISDILNRQTRGPSRAAPTKPPHLREPLSQSELRVLRYLPTNLTMQEIANQLSVSVNTVKAHARHLYAKLGIHSRSGAVEQARVLRLPAPSSRSPGE